MTGQLAYLREKLETSFWLIPSLLCLLCGATGIATLWFDRALRADYGSSLIGEMSVDSARQLLGVIAGSVISVGGVTFSVTMVALTLTSGQYGPKIVRHFLEDIGSKICLGLFLGTFVFALIALTGFTETDRPHLTVVIALLLAFSALVGFIQFIHHTATELQADKIIERLGGQLRDALAELCAAKALEGRSSSTMRWRSAARSRRKLTIAANRAGYIQAIDYSRLIDWCAENGCQLMVRVAPGEFLVEGVSIMAVFGCTPETLASGISTLQDAIVTGPIRTPVQDPAFPVTQLNQLIARALSPGINDPGTAITCIDWFSLSLSPVIDRDLPGCVLEDPDGTPRVLVRCPRFDQLISVIYAPLREMAISHVEVTASVFDSISRLAELTLRRDRLHVLKREANELWESIPADSLSAQDRRSLQRRYSRLRALTRTPNT